MKKTKVAQAEKFKTAREFGRALGLSDLDLEMIRQKKRLIEKLRDTQTKLAAHLGWSHAKVNEIINGKRGVTAETALAFSDAFGSSAEFWINLQTNHDLWEAQQEHKKVKKIA